jgi:ABC-type antimicrobial peptide transport system permease subunit
MITAVYIKMALRSISSNKWRSFLTMLGVLIGVMSVVTIVSLGEGVRQQIIDQVNLTGSDLITVRPGQLIERDEGGNIVNVNFLSANGGGSLSESDIATINKTKGVGGVVPFGLLNTVATYEGAKKDILVIGTTNNMPSAVSRKVLYGNFFGPGESGSPVAVLGHKVAEDLFKENAPISKTFQIRNKDIVVRGVMEHFESDPLNPGFDYNNAIFLPYQFAKDLGGGQLQNYQVLVRPATGQKVTDTVRSLELSLTRAHGGNADFTVLKASDNLAIASSALSLLTALVAGIAAISLLVGGIGIMNIMLVSVSERTHEIGVRKSVGATNGQILGQFFVEAIVLSGVGGILGVLASLLANYAIRLTTSLEPAVSVQIMLAAFVVALLVGSFFGLMPALKAARKDPIESLRRV